MFGALALSPIVGIGLSLLERERELARVDQLIGDAAAGRPVLAVIILELERLGRRAEL